MEVSAHLGEEYYVLILILCDQPRQIGQLSIKITLIPVITDKGLLPWCAEASLELKNEVFFHNDVVRFMRF